MPTKDGVGSDKRSNFGEGASSDGFTSNRESAALSVGQPESPVPELLREDSVLLSEVFDDRILLSGDPTGHGGDEDLPGLKDNGHRLIVPTLRDNRQLSAGGETR